MPGYVSRLVTTRANDVKANLNLKQQKGATQANPKLFWPEAQSAEGEGQSARNSTNFRPTLQPLKINFWSPTPRRARRNGRSSCSTFPRNGCSRNGCSRRNALHYLPKVNIQI
eukprot:2901994-Pleurochrysis_carterae.AAC.2